MTACESARCIVADRSVGYRAVSVAVVLSLAGCIVKGPQLDTTARPVRICHTAGELPEIAQAVARVQRGSSWQFAEECAVPDWLARRDPLEKAGWPEPPRARSLPQLMRPIPQVLVTPLSPPRRPGEPRSQ